MRGQVSSRRRLGNEWGQVNNEWAGGRFFFSPGFIVAPLEAHVAHQNSFLLHLQGSATRVYLAHH